MVLLLCVCLFAFTQVNGAQEYKVRLRIRPQAGTTVESLQSTMCAVLMPAAFASVDDCAFASVDDCLQSGLLWN